MWGALLGGLGAVAEGLFGSHSQSSANRANIKLQREQQSWEAMMSNTAVTRRAQDIENAGGNRALAFTGGQEASTPTVSPARVEPTYRGGSNAISAMATAMQMKQMQAQTRLTTNQARSAGVEAELREQLMTQERDARGNRLVEQVEWDDLKTKLMRTQDKSTGLQVKQLEESWQALVKTAKMQAEKGSLDVAQLKSIVDTFGLGAEAKTDIITKLSRLIYMMISGAKP